jgi:hypothetical protein
MKQSKDRLAAVLNIAGFLKHQTRSLPALYSYFRLLDDVGTRLTKREFDHTGVHFLAACGTVILWITDVSEEGTEIFKLSDQQDCRKGDWDEQKKPTSHPSSL